VWRVFGGIPLPVPTHFRFVVRGMFVNTPEEWSFGTHFTRAETAGPDAGLDDVSESGVTAAVDAFIGTSNFQSSVKATDWRMYVIGTDGKMEGNGPLLHDYTGSGPVGGGSLKYPPQVSVAITCVADNRGPAKLGRFYLPGPGKALGTDLRMSAADAGFLGSDVTTFLKAVSDSIDMPFTTSAKGVNVSSRGGAGAGTIQEIDHLEVGRVFDTIRSRRRSLDEDRQVVAQIDW